MIVCHRPGCLVEFTPHRHQVYCSANCRYLAHQARVESGLPAKVRSVRMLASGKVSLVLHVDDAAHLKPGSEVAVLEKGIAA